MLGRIVSNRYDQIMLLSYLLKNETFLAEYINHLRSDDFDLPILKLIYEILKKYFNKYKAAPTQNIFLDEIANAVSGKSDIPTTITKEEYDGLVEVIKLIIEKQFSSNDALYMKDRLKDFLLDVRLNRILHSGLPTTELDEQLRKAREEIENIFNTERNNIYFNISQIKIPKKNVERRFGTGLTRIDRHINGGLVKKQAATIVAFTGVGKTTGLINFCVNAAFRNIHSLFITLELSFDSIFQRIEGIFSNIEAKYYHIDESEWPTNIIAQRNFARALPVFNCVSVADYSDKLYSISDIEDCIKTWKSHKIEREGVPEDNLMLVCVDWAERLDRRGISSITRQTNDATAIKIIVDRLSELARRQNVILWTAMQARREASTREVIGIEHTAHSIHAHDALDLSLGLAVVSPPDDNLDVTETDDTNFAICDRKLNVSFLKTRYSSAVGRHVSIYQGPTLRFWDTKEMADRAMALSKNNDYEALYKFLISKQ